MAEESEVKVEHEEGLTRIVVDRPKALNALTTGVLKDLMAAFGSLPAHTRVVIVTGAGDRAFVAGADIKEMSSFGADDACRFSLDLHELGDRIEALDVPVIAAVNGYALGGGCELLLACDFALASEKASFGLPEVGLGVMPGFGGTTRLTRRVGEARARQLVFTGKPIDAVEAFRIGLVNEVVGHDELPDRARAVATQIARNAPLSIAYAKRSLRHGEESDLKSANAYEAQTFGLCFATEDQTEGMAAFIEKRTPKWKGV